MYDGLTSIANRAADIGSIAKSVAFSSMEMATTAGYKAISMATETGETIKTTADHVGLTKNLDSMQKLATQSAKTTNAKAARLLADSNKAVLKARRLANKTLDLEEEEDNGNESSNFDLLLTADGAATCSLAIYATFQQAYTVRAGSALVYKARVKKWDIGFGIFEKNGNQDSEIEPVVRYESATLIKGIIPADPTRDRNIILFFDNSYSQINRKKIAYWVAIGPNVSLSDDTVGAAREMEITAAEEGPDDPW